MNPRRTIEVILVLCEGNHCRSPIAEGLLKEAMGPQPRVISAGLAAKEGYSAHPWAIRLMAERGLNITSHRSHQVTTDMIIASDLILVMDHQQKEWCDELVPGSLDRISLLGRWLPGDEQEIADPMAQSVEVFQLTFDKILRSVEVWRDHLKNLRGSE